MHPRPPAPQWPGVGPAPGAALPPQRSAVPPLRQESPFGSLYPTQLCHPWRLTSDAIFWLLHGKFPLLVLPTRRLRPRGRRQLAPTSSSRKGAGQGLWARCVGPFQPRSTFPSRKSLQPRPQAETPSAAWVGKSCPAISLPRSFGSLRAGPSHQPRSQHTAELLQCLLGQSNRLTPGHRPRDLGDSDGHIQQFSRPLPP